MPHSILVACINCAIGILPTGLVSALPRKEAQVEKRVTPRPLPAFVFSLVDMRSGVLLSVPFEAEATDAQDFSSGEGVWFRGTGCAMGADGWMITDQLSIDLRFKLGQKPEKLIQVGDSAVASFGRDSVVDWVEFGPDRTHATVVSLRRQSVATVQVDTRLGRLLDTPSLAVLLAQVHGILTQAPEDASRAAAFECTPTFAECLAAAQAACGADGVESCQYRCNQSTGEAECSFKCKSTPG